jgi:hypothetical protein
MTDDTDDLRDRVAQLEHRVTALEREHDDGDPEESPSTMSDSAWVVEIIRDLTDDGDRDGAAIQAVIEAAAEDGVDDPQSELAELKRLGTIYAPEAGRVKVT